MKLLDVPVIDIAPFLAGRRAAKAAVAARGGPACRDIGFLVIHGDTACATRSGSG